MSARCCRGVQLAASLLLPIVLSACALAEQYRWTGVERIVALSDPHGDYPALIETLGNAGVIDAELAWKGGTSHLVITGDLLDRGPESRKIMDLVMRLEVEAVEQGGRVHLTLGNHEVMNLVGDLRYVSVAEYAAFAQDEPADVRENWFQRYKSAQSLQGEPPQDDAALRTLFDSTRPAGFFAHRQAFGSEGKYGRWLLQKPLMVVVNDTAFVHGGLPSMVGESGLEELNNRLRAEVTDYVRQFELLVRAELIDSAANFHDHAELAEALALDAGLSPDVQAAIQTVIELNNSAIHSSSGPLWYRGTVACNALTEGDVLAEALAAIGAERVVIGHTPTISRQVLQRFDGRVIEIDTGMLNSSYQGSGNALIIVGDSLSVVNENTDEVGRPLPHPRRVGARDRELSAEILQQLLASAEIVASRTDDAGRKIVELTRADNLISALFVPTSRAKGVNTELAAYRLDQLLGLDMVPVTVAREVDGEPGTLQFLPENSSDEARRSANGRGGRAQCPLPRQWNSMYIFDALVHNEGRAPYSMTYSPESWQLLLVGHANAFGTKRRIPKYLGNVSLEFTTAWVEALTSLSDEKMTESLGDVLDNRRLKALGKRRDVLLEEAVKLAIN